MRTKDATKLAKIAQVVSKDVPKAKSRHIKPTSPPKESNLGRQIFIYNHLQTNQVVYSLTKVLKNNHALRQLPYNGKKTVPAALRKDLWAPLALIDIHPTATPANADTKLPPATPQSYGLRVFQRMREYRKLHETQWPASFALDPKTNRPLSRVERGRRLCDQKANSIADMAAALAAVTVKMDVKDVEVEVERVDEKGEKKKEKVVRKMKVASPLADVRVQWSNMLDAEFAKAWPKSVVHDQWETTFNNRRASVGGMEEVQEVDLVDMEAAPELVRNEAGKVVL